MKNILILLALAGIFSSCSKTETAQPTKSDVVPFTASIVKRTADSVTVQVSVHVGTDQVSFYNGNGLITAIVVKGYPVDSKGFLNVTMLGQTVSEVKDSPQNETIIPN